MRESGPRLEQRVLPEDVQRVMRCLETRDEQGTKDMLKAISALEVSDTVRFEDRDAKGNWSPGVEQKIKAFLDLPTEEDRERYRCLKHVIYDLVNLLGKKYNAGHVLAAARDEVNDKILLEAIEQMLEQGHPAMRELLSSLKRMDKRSAV